MIHAIRVMMRRFPTWPVAASIVLLMVAALILAIVRHRPSLAATSPAPSAAMPAASAPASLPMAPTLTGPGGFAPLQSQAVKDAIHRALETGATQRWQDGQFSGYAVPSLATGANGCRAVRYTIDQQPTDAYGSITACDASAH